MCINTSKTKNKGGAGADGAGNGSGARTPPMQSLARDANTIRMDRAELEVNPGTGQTVQKALPKLLEENKAG